MSKKPTDYTKPQVLKMFRRWADSGKPWLELQANELPKVKCIGDLYPLPPDSPANTPRHARLGTALDKVALRHALRDVYKAVRMADRVSNARMDSAFRDRAKSEGEYRAFFDETGRRGEYYRLRQDIERLESAELRVRKVSVLDDRRRCLAAVRDSAVERFAAIEDERFFFNEVCLKYVEAFADYRQWTPPDRPDPLDVRNPQMIAIDSLDFSEIGLDDSEVFYVEHLSGKMVGSVKGGPMYFTNQKAAWAYTDNAEKFSISRDTLTPDRVQSTCLWYAERHRYTSDEPKHAKFLYLEYPALTATAPPDDQEFAEEFEAVQPRKGW